MRILRGLKQVHRAPEVLRCYRFTDHWSKLLFAYVGLPTKFPFSITTRDGVRIPFQEITDVQTFWQIFIAGLYPVRSTDTVIVDAGANVGYFTLYALQKSPRCCVISIEPAPDCYLRLCELVSASGMMDRCRSLNVGLGDESGRAMLGSEIGGEPTQFRRVGSAGRIPVQLLTMDEVLKGYESVDLLKMDIEGSEYDVFRVASVATVRKIRRICMEYHPLYIDNAVISRVNELIARLAVDGLQMTSRVDFGDGYGVLNFARESCRDESVVLRAEKSQAAATSR